MTVLCHLILTASAIEVVPTMIIHTPCSTQTQFHSSTVTVSLTTPDFSSNLVQFNESSISLEVTDGDSPVSEDIFKHAASSSRQKYLIGGIIGGGVVVFIATAVTLGIMIRGRKRGHMVNQTSGNLVENTRLQLGATTRRNLFAFKKRATTTAQHLDDGDKIKRSAVGVSNELNSEGCFRMRENYCYSASSTQSCHTASGEHEYDVPISDTKVLPREYETPIESSLECSTKPQNVYDTVIEREQIYEEIMI
jgi:hypothetical protein